MTKKAISKLNLPIDTIRSLPGTSGQLRFRWKMKTKSIPGKTSLECSGSLPPSVEDAVAALIMMVKQKEKVIETLVQEIKELRLQVAAQSSLEEQPTQPQTSHKRKR